MAAKLTTGLGYLVDFATGQGVSGGLANYVNYPTDFDINFGLIQSTVNQMIDELNASRLTNSSIPNDLLLRRDLTLQGRYSHDAAAITRSTDTVTVGNGLIYAAGRRMDVTTQAFDFTGLPNGTYYIAVDETGLLSNSTTAASKIFDLVTVVWDGSMLDADVTDNLFQSGRTLGNTDQGFLQGQHTPPAEISSQTDVDFPQRLAPPIRYLGSTGTLGDAGFFASPGTAANSFGWVSERDGGAGTGDTVLSALCQAQGQLALLEQGRVQVIRSTTQSIGNVTVVPVEFDTLPATNVAGDPERFEPEAYFASTTWQSGTGNRDIVIPSSSDLNGTWLFTATVEMVALTVAGYLDVHLVQTVGGTATIARERIQPPASGIAVVTISGMYDFVNGDEFQLQVEHDNGAAANLTNARVTALLVGGAV